MHRGGLDLSDMDDARQATLASLFAAVQSITQAGAVALGDRTASSTRQLLATLAHDGEMRVSDLGAALRIAPPVIAHAAEMLEAQGLVQRRTDPETGRCTLVDVTDAGREHVAEWLARLTTVLHQGLEHLSSEDWEVLDRAVELLRSVDREAVRPVEGTTPTGLRAV